MFIAYFHLTGHVALKLTHITALRSCQGWIHKEDTLEPLQAGRRTAHAALFGLFAAADAPNHDLEPTHHFNRRCEAY